MSHIESVLPMLRPAVRYSDCSHALYFELLIQKEKKAPEEIKKRINPEVLTNRFVEVQTITHLAIV